MPTYYLPGSSIVSVNVPAQFDVPCAPPGASHAQKERGPGCFHHFMDVHPGRSKCEPAAWRGILLHL